MYDHRRHRLARIRLYVSPADPTLSLQPFDQPHPQGDIPPTLTSYAYNWLVFDTRKGQPRLSSSFPDGTASTLMWGEHYARCNYSDFQWDLSVGELPSFSQVPAYFAFNAHLKTTGNPPTTRMDVPPEGIGTFQVQPCTVRRASGKEPSEAQAKCGSRPLCNPFLNQTPHPSGMLAALMDGSVRTLNPGIRHEVFWGAVTPAGGEILGDW